MVAKITIGSGLFGAIKYNADKVNEGKGQLLDTNKIFNDGTGKVDIAQVLHDFERHMPLQMRTEKPVIHVSLNPHPDDRLTDRELTEMAHEYMQRMGYGDQPYIIVKHEDIDRHHLHIISVRVDEQGKRINSDFTHKRSLAIVQDFERRYNLHKGEKRENKQQNPLHPVNPDTGDIKKQVRNTIKAVFRDNQFQTIGELRALLSLYNMTVEEVRGNAKGEDYNGLVYSVIDANGEKIGNPFKSSLFGKSVGYEALQRKATFSKKNIRKRVLTVFSVTQMRADYTVQPSLTIALIVSSMVPVWVRSSLQTHSTNTSTPRLKSSIPSLNTKVTNKSGIMTAIRIPTAVRVKRNSHLMTAVLNTAIAHRVPRPSLMPLTSSIPITLLRMPKKRHSDADFSARRKSVVVQDCNHRLLITTKFKVLCNKKMI